MATGLDEVDMALYKKLKNDQALVNMVTGVFDYVPEGTKKPYVVINEMEVQPVRTFDRDGGDASVTLDILSDYEGNEEAFKILDRLKTMLDYQPLAVSGYQTVYCRFESAKVITANSGKLRHIPAEFSVMVMEGSS